MRQDRVQKRKTERDSLETANAKCRKDIEPTMLHRPITTTWWQAYGNPTECIRCYGEWMKTHLTHTRARRSTRGNCMFSFHISNRNRRFCCCFCCCRAFRWCWESNFMSFIRNEVRSICVVKPIGMCSRRCVTVGRARAWCPLQKSNIWISLTILCR